eukprot:GHUV01042339.1.p1 GENE.GHUV01042339.1~~GHUV01042339.1.p1  ORF type:complete len:104 (+),score=1.79 GHUV01042339.1:207-518(+)
MSPPLRTEDAVRTWKAPEVPSRSAHMHRMGACHALDGLSSIILSQQTVPSSDYKTPECNCQTARDAVLGQRCPQKRVFHTVMMGTKQNRHETSMVVVSNGPLQ